MKYFILIILLYACQPKVKVKSSPYDTMSISQVYDMINKKKPKAEDSQDTLSEKEKQARKESLLKKFRKKTDDFRDITFLTANPFGFRMPMKTTIYSYINEYGDLFLVSNYFSDHWIFHESVTVKIDDASIDTEEVSPLDKNNVHDASGGDIYENITYRNGSDIVRFIANNVNKKVQIRFHGEKFYKDITLTQQEKIAFKNTYELYTLLK